MYTVRKEKEVKRKITFKKQLFEGIHFMKNVLSFWFLLATLYAAYRCCDGKLFIPVYISDILKANASVYAIEG